jgi:ATP/maltotriose-dependent transcriptional regulator MalT
LDLARLAWIVETLDPRITGDREDLLALVHAAETATDHGDPDLALSLLSAAAANSFWANRDEAHDEIVSATERVGVRPDDPRLLSILSYAALPGEVAMVIERVARWPADRSHDAASMQLLGTAAFNLGFHALASKFLTASIDTMRDQGRLVQLAQSLVMRAWSEINLGHWTLAAPDAEEGSRLAQETAQPLWEAGAFVAQAFLLAMRGEEHESEALIARAEKIAVPAASRVVVAVVQLTRGMTALAYGRYEEAYAELQRMLDPADLAHHRLNFYWAVANLSEAAVPLGRTREVRVIVEQLEAQAAQTPSPVFQQTMRHSRPLLATDATAEEMFRASLRGDLVGGPFEHARLQVAYGVWLRRQRRAAESREPLRAARDSFDALGAVIWSERARRELRAAGESSQRRQPGLLEQLSAQELQVAQMAADGLSNREIGQKLYLSHRTVSSHLYRAYPKLGITSRAQLRDVVGQSARTGAAGQLIRIQSCD